MLSDSLPHWLVLYNKSKRDVAGHSIDSLAGATGPF